MKGETFLRAKEREVYSTERNEKKWKVEIREDEKRERANVNRQTNKQVNKSSENRFIF